MAKCANIFSIVENWAMYVGHQIVLVTSGGIILQCYNKYITTNITTIITTNCSREKITQKWSYFDQIS